MLQGVYGIYGAYGAYKAGYTARSGSVGGASVSQVDPIRRASAVMAPAIARAETKQPASAAPQMSAAAGTAAAADTKQPAAAFAIPDANDSKYTAPEMAVRARILPFENPAEAEKNKAAQAEVGIKAGEMEELGKDTECQTCKERKYQDESDDSSVSFQSPQSINPAAVASTVRGHEMEHVYNEQAKAKREDRKVISQSVVLHSAICPDCGETYISGGTTRTVTKANNSNNQQEQEAAAQAEAKKPA